MTPFQTPDEYILAMQAIGYRPFAAFHFKEDGSVHRMGVIEREPLDPAKQDEAHWLGFKRSVMCRCPTDVGWWSKVRDRLWELGMRENVLPWTDTGVKP